MFFKDPKHVFSRLRIPLELILICSSTILITRILEHSAYLQNKYTRIRRKLRISYFSTEFEYDENQNIFWIYNFSTIK